MALTKLQNYIQKKNRELSEEEKQQIRDRIERGDEDVFKIAAEFHCVPAQVAGIKAVMNRGVRPRGAPIERDRIRALSIRQPYAHAILLLGKDVENRSRRSHYRGPLLVHASARLEPNPREALSRCINDPPSDEDLNALPRECIVGVVDLVDCVDNSKSKWAEQGKWHWILKNPKTIDPIECTGRLGLWPLSIEVLKKLPTWLKERFGAGDE